MRAPIRMPKATPSRYNLIFQYAAVCVVESAVVGGA